MTANGIALSVHIVLLDCSRTIGILAAYIKRVAKMIKKEILDELLKIRMECKQHKECNGCGFRCGDGACFFEDLPFAWNFSYLNTGGEND